MKRYAVFCITSYDNSVDLELVNTFNDWLEAVYCCHHTGHYILDNETEELHYDGIFKGLIEKTLLDFAWYMLPEVEPEHSTIYIAEGGKIMGSNRSLAEELIYQEQHRFDLTEEDKNHLREYEQKG